MIPAPVARLPGQDAAARLASRYLRIGTILTGAALLAATSWRMTGSARLAEITLLAGVAATAWVVEWGARVTLIVVCLCIIPPGVGENSAALAGLAGLSLYGTLVTAPRERDQLAQGNRLIPALLVGEGVVFVLSALLPGFPASRATSSLFLLYVVGGLSVYEAARRPELVTRALRSLTWLVALLSASYLVSAVLGFAGGSALYLKYRNFIAYPPFTLAQPGGGFLHGFPRFVVLSGEPGLGAIFLVIAIACAVRLETGRRRAVLLLLLGCGSLFAQSTGLVFALVGLVVGAAVVELTRRFTLAVSAVLALGLIPLLKLLTDYLLATKLTDNPGSLLDRGFSVSGFRADSTTIDISLLAALAHHPWLAVPLVLVIVALALSALRSPLRLGLVLAIGSIALYSQPLQWHPGAWVMLAFCTAVFGGSVVRS